MAKISSAESRPEVRIVLTDSPNHWTLFDIIYWIIAAVLKHALAFTGYTAPLKVDRTGRQTFKLPHIQVEGQLRLHDGDVHNFDQAVRQGRKAIIQDQGAVLNPLFLVAMTVPLVIRILADRRCPVKPLGAVNTRNVFKFVDPTSCVSSELLLKAANAGTLSYQASFGGANRPGQRRKRGMEFCITVSVFNGDILIVEQELWFLQFLPKRTEPRFEQLAGEDERAAPTLTSNPNATSLDIDMSDPKRWAASCKDYNPIHVSTIGARIFGFRSVIAHGNHVAGLVLEQLRDVAVSNDVALSGAQSICCNPVRPFSLEVSFLRPITLPARCNVQWSRDDQSPNAVSLGVWVGEKLCLRGNAALLVDHDK